MLVPQKFEAQLAAVCERIAAEHQLTAREQEVLSLLASGRSRPYIEAALHISTGTAKTHILHIYDKMGVHDREQLLDLAQKYMKELSQNTSA
ncbi:MAG: response regulator transcription factor [Coriobacteriia bacterium]